MSLESFIALNRFGFGPGLQETIPGDDVRGWLTQQLSDGRNAAIPTYNLPDSPSLVRQVFALKQQKKDDKGSGMQDDDKKKFRDLVLTGLDARFIANMTGLPLVERLTLFWSNHFTVSLKGKPVLGPLCASMERDAIRPYVLGRFEDMLQAVTRHPAMLIYLDNATSIGPDLLGGERRKAGLNENLGRELLELHTLGAQGGYTQADVTSMAKILTGWTLDKPRQGGSGDFLFVDKLHEPGPQTVMGLTYEQNGVEQGQAALHDLAHHPSTAKFIATKLVRHFVADAPPAADIATIADVFSASGGDLLTVTQAIMNLPGVWQNPLPKVKTPYEMILSALRATGIPADKIPYPRIHGALALLGQAPFTAPSPAGWSDLAGDWISPEALMNRVELCHMIAQRTTPPGVNPSAMAQSLIGPVASTETLTSIQRAPSPVDGFALLLASAEFQRR